MELLDNEQQSKFQTFSCGNAKVTFDDNGYVVKAKDFSPLHITEQTKKDVLEHPEKYSDCDARTRMGMFYTDEEKERYIEESLSRPLPGVEEKGPTLVKRRIPPKK